MAQLTYGTDTYGRVKAVDGTPIVTTFFMLQFIPIYPLQSFYFLGDGPTTASGIPFLTGSTSTAIRGIPLAKVDRASVAVAFARGIFGTLGVVGFLGAMFPAISWLGGERLDRGAQVAAVVLLFCFAVGAIGGVLTYIIPLTSPREHAIRHYCGELLGASVDPAHVKSEVADLLLAHANDRCAAAGDHRAKLSRDLIAIRVLIARTQDIEKLDAKTDEILAQLKQYDGSLQ